MAVPADLVLLPPGALDEELARPLDEVADEACESLGLPKLGGPSGRGWSYYSTFQTCPHLGKETYGGDDEGDGRERTKPSEELQIGGFYHLLQALYYAYGLSGDGRAFHYNRGLLAPHLVKRLGDKVQQGALVRIPEDAADRLLATVKREAAQNVMDAALQQALVLTDGNAEDDGDLTAALEESIPVARPSLNFVLEAERLFDAHSNYYGSGEEDVRPLAIEWHARHPIFPYTCRYDAIVEIGAHDPLVRNGVAKAGDIYIHERKSAKWLSPFAQDGWFLDGEILGQLLLWESSGCARLFGPLAGLIVDIVTKEKRPKCHRVLVPKNPITVAAHERGIRWQVAEQALWRTMQWWPKRWISCFRFGRPCGLYEKCRQDTAQEIADEMAAAAAGVIDVDFEVG